MTEKKILHNKWYLYLTESSGAYAIQRYVMPLVASGQLKMSHPDKPRSPKQLYYSE